MDYFESVSKLMIDALDFKGNENLKFKVKTKLVDVFDGSDFDFVML